jgi:hypothetical protein
MLPPRTVNLEKNEAPLRAERRAKNTLALKDAWHRLLQRISNFPIEGGKNIAVNGLEIPSSGAKETYSLDLEVSHFYSLAHIDSKLLSLALRSFKVDDKGKLHFPVLAEFEMKGGLDELGRVSLTSYLRTEPGYEGLGIGSGLVLLLPEIVALLRNNFAKEWSDKIVYAVQTDLAVPASKQGASRAGWSTAQIAAQGYTVDSEYVRKYLGEDFLPLPEKTMVRVYQHPDL